MRTRRLVVAVALTLSAAALACRGLAQEGVKAGGRPPALPAAAVKILENAKELELVSIDPREDKGQAGYKVLGQTVVKDEAKRNEVLKALYKSVAEGKGLAKCFEPRHIIRASSGGKTVELVICFECDRLHLNLSGEKEHVIVPISGSAQPVLNKILTDAGIKIAP